MDIKKFKSVAVAIDTYKLLKKLAAHLVKQEAKRRKIDE
jgi:hypothetical protein